MKCFQKKTFSVFGRASDDEDLNYLQKSEEEIQNLHDELEAEQDDSMLLWLKASIFKDLFIFVISIAAFNPEVLVKEFLEVKAPQSKPVVDISNLTNGILYYNNGRYYFQNYKNMREKTELADLKQLEKFLIERHKGGLKRLVIIMGGEVPRDRMREILNITTPLGIKTVDAGRADF